jgi:5-methylcytosine-specific restriction endonuclease McrA
VDLLSCIWCQSVVPEVIPKRCGKRPSFCSTACRSSYRKDYHARWRSVSKGVLDAYRDANRDRIRAHGREFYRQNTESRKEHRRRCYRQNREQALESARKYAEANKDLIRVIGRRSAATRRARIFGAFVEVVDPVVVFARDGGICGICGVSVGQDSWEVDHRIPLARGGLHSYDNVQVSHARCNRSKGARCQ